MRPRRLIACGLAALALFAASDSGWMPRSARGQTPVEIELATWWWTVPTRSDALRKIGALLFGIGVLMLLLRKATIAGDYSRGVVLIILLVPAALL